VRGLLKSDIEQEYQELYDSCMNNLKKQLWISLKVPIPLREKLSYIAWAIIPSFMSKRCKNKVRIKIRKKQKCQNTLERTVSVVKPELH
jgi:hypothetical protein